ncbi:MAG TPA: FlgD immunoglobulin-like domain containing protein [Fimbriimonadaceae bacterium]|nr:FlgD immunoglobulin-like domain containing protein [Fimbriimonadaceae bacterium]
MYSIIGRARSLVFGFLSLAILGGLRQATGQSFYRVQNSIFPGTTAKPQAAGQIAFSFTLDKGYNTTAGAFTASGTLVKTIWRNVRYPAGTFQGIWDGTDDSGHAVPAGIYQIRVLYHNVKYVWDGIVGNTSGTFNGDATWRSYFNMGSSGSLAIYGNNAFYGIGYIEGQANLRRFAVSNPLAPWDIVPQNQGAVWTLVATDGIRYYMADTGDGMDSYSSTFVVGYNVADGTESSFSAGAAVQTGQPYYTQFSSAIDVSQKSTGAGAVHDDSWVAQNAATGLAVQTSGNLLAVAHGPLNLIRMFDKTSGAALGTISVNAPGSVAFDANGDLWVLTGTTAVRYTSVATSPTVAATITGLSQPIAVATHPTDRNVVLIADGGQSQQVKAFNSSGDALWTYGVPGGYTTNGPVVGNSIFQFTGGRVPLAFQSDGSFWVGDGATNRLLHFSASRAYLNQIEYTPGSYCSTVDDNDPTRVFDYFLEYRIDYSKPLQPGDPGAAGGNGSWKLVRNWAAGVNPKYIGDTARWAFSGFGSVQTLANGRTYGLVRDWSDGGLGHYSMVMELTASGLRETGTKLGNGSKIYPDGSLRWITTTNGVQTIFQSALVGFDGNNNPLWANGAPIASYPATGQTAAVSTAAGSGPIPMTSSGVLVTLNASTPYSPGDLGANTTGMHLGGVKAGMNNFLWQASPSVPTDIPLDGLGSFDVGDSITYAATVPMASGRNVVYGYNGEFWNQSEADQFMHFWDDGLFVGQFGTPGDTVWPAGYEVPGLGGNEATPELVTTHSGETYLYTADEAEHGGIHRWHLVGAGAIRELAGSASLGGSATLSPMPAGAAGGLVAVSGSQQVSLTWKGISLTKVYRVKFSTQPGGPYSVAASKISSTSYNLTGLTNGVKYYFVVCPMIGESEYPASDEIAATPNDPAVPVHAAGQADYRHQQDNHYVVASSSMYPLRLETAAANLGTLAITNLGRGGYYLFDFPAVGSNLNRLPAGASVIAGSGWSNHNPWEVGYLVVDGVAGPRSCLVATSDLSSASTLDATITVDPGDAKWHYLTLFSPPTFANTRNFSVVVTPRGQVTPSASQSVSEAYGRGSYHLIQFMIKGPVTVTIPAGAIDPNLQGIFLDPVDGG